MLKVDVCLIVEGTYPLELGGISTWCDALLQGLPHRSFALVRIGVPSLDNPKDWLFERPTALHGCQHVSPPDAAGFEDVIAWARDVGRALPDACVYQGVAAGYAGIVAMEAARAHQSTFVLSEHASYVRELMLGNVHLESGVTAPGEDPVALFARFAACLRREAHATTCLESRTAHEQCLAGASNVHIIPNGVRALPRPASKRRRPRPLVLYLGRLHPLKGPELLLQALREVPRLDIDVEFAGPLQGDPCWRVELSAALEAEPRAQWVGAVGPNHLTERMPDVLVVPSRSEAQPLVILEAMMAGVPVVAMDVGDCRQMLGVGSQEPAGVVVRDVAALARSLRTLLSDSEARSRFSEHGRRRALRDHTQQRMIERFDRLYDRYCS